jgi:hypothetical protein
MISRAAVRGNCDVAVAVAQVEERGSALPPGLAAGRVQEQHRAVTILPPTLPAVARKSEAWSHVAHFWAVAITRP